MLLSLSLTTGHRLPPWRDPDSVGRYGRRVRIPRIRGVIERRLLINYRVDPGALSSVLPEPFRPVLVDGAGIAGICLIRLGSLRPAVLPGRWGLSSENGAHRIAAAFPDGAEGVYIPRRDTNARLNILVGGRLFPGFHHHASFEVADSVDRVELTMESDDGAVRVEVAASPTSMLAAGSVFSDLDAVSAFFERGSLGYSDTRDPARFDGLELRTEHWAVTPLAVDHVYSSFFEDGARFPSGTVEFDNALLMRGIRHEWRARESLYCSETAAAG